MPHAPSPPPFKLSSTLAGHASDVRSLSTCASGPVLFSSSRDGTARSWYRGGMDEGDGHGGGWVEGVEFGGQHEGFVNAVQWVSGEGEGELCCGSEVARSSGEVDGRWELELL